LVFSSISAWAGPVQKSLPTAERASLFLIIALAPIILGLAYAAGATWLASHMRWMSHLATAGRMSLTNYLLQSVVMTCLFYHYGLKMFDQVRPTSGFLLAVMIYAGQVGLSSLWFRRFRFGPAEWVWRLLTYGKLIKITRMQGD
jgi:uncharacterized protein